MDHALRYMTRFRCIGPACEHSCCEGWRVDVDEAHYRKLKKAMNGSARDREAFRAIHLRNRDDASRGPARYAQMRLAPSGACGQLGADRLCDVQRRFGEEMLLYPRAIPASRRARARRSSSGPARA